MACRLRPLPALDGGGFLLSLSALLKAGTSLIDALELLRDRAQPMSLNGCRRSLSSTICRSATPCRHQVRLAGSSHHQVDPPFDRLRSAGAGSRGARSGGDGSYGRDSRTASRNNCHGSQVAIFAVLVWFLQATNQLSDLMQSGSIPNQ